MYGFQYQERISELIRDFELAIHVCDISNLVKSWEWHKLSIGLTLTHRMIDIPITSTRLSLLCVLFSNVSSFQLMPTSVSVCAPRNAMCTATNCNPVRPVWQGWASDRFYVISTLKSQTDTTGHWTCGTAWNLKTSIPHYPNFDWPWLGCKVTPAKNWYQVHSLVVLYAVGYDCNDFRFVLLSNDHGICRILQQIKW